MKKQFLKYVTVTSFMIIIGVVACNKKAETEQLPSQKKEIQRKTSATCNSSTSLNQTFRALIGNGNTVQMSMVKLASNTVNVSTTSVARISSDRSTLSIFDASLNAVLGKVEVPNDGNEYWIVYYDQSNPPLKLTGDVTYTCSCNVEGKSGCDPSITDCIVTCALSGECQLAQSSCCKSTSTDDGTGTLVTTRSPAVILQADAINYNGVLYN
jgi:hypothetical protein